MPVSALHNILAQAAVDPFLWRLPFNVQYSTVRELAQAGLEGGGWSLEAARSPLPSPSSRAGSPATYF